MLSVLLFVFASQLLGLRSILHGIYVAHQVPSWVSVGKVLVEAAFFYLMIVLGSQPIAGLATAYRNLSGSMMAALQTSGTSDQSLAEETAMERAQEAEEVDSSANAYFFSYRREDTRNVARKLNRLFSRTGAGFYDFESIPPGADFEEVISQAIAHCQVVVVLMGMRWLTSVDTQGRRRIDDPHDFVRREILMALQAGKPILVLLVDGARMPIREELPEEISALADCPHHAIRGHRARTDFLLLLARGA